MTSTQRIAHGLCTALALALAASGGEVRGQAPAAPVAVAPQPGDDTVTLNFVGADVHAVIKAVAEMTGRNFLIDPRVQGTVGVIDANINLSSVGLVNAAPQSLTSYTVSLLGG